MPSQACRVFRHNRTEVQRLFSFYVSVGHGSRERELKQVLHRAAVVMITTYWEVYCEDVIVEALMHLADHLDAPDAVSEPIKAAIAMHLRDKTKGHSPWRLAGEGWRQVLRDYATGTLAGHSWGIDNPSSKSIANLFVRAVGVSVTEAWECDGRPRDAVIADLDRWIHIRHEIVHKGSSNTPLSKAEVKRYLLHVQRLVKATDEYLRGLLQAHTKVAPWDEWVDFHGSLPIEPPTTH
jgi:hypothetical protein